MNDTASIELPPLWPLKRLRVHGLFEINDLEIDLDSAATILTGENGSGKSTILRAIHCLAEAEWPTLIELPLRGVDLEFIDGASLWANQDDETLSIGDGGDNVWEIDLGGSKQNRARRLQLERLRHRMLEASPAERQRLGMHLERVRRRYGESEEVEFLDRPDWLNACLQRFNTRLISARRLEHRLRPDDGGPGDERPISVVDRFAMELGEKMRDELSGYAAESRRKEKVLPSQIVKAMQAEEEEEAADLANDVDQLKAEVKDLAVSLARVGLFQEEEPDPIDEYPRDNTAILRAVREVYRVTLDRLQRLTQLRSELDLFATFLNDRFSHKTVELDQGAGLDVVLERDGQHIRPSQLSSGEQQILALAYELLFQTEKDSVVLLDEPELSLHVGWLQSLASAFLGMGQERRLQFIIATHSPSVLAGHTERERSLDQLLVDESL